MMRFFKTKIGIAVLAVAGVVAVYYLYNRYQKSKAAAPAPKPVGQPADPQKQGTKLAAPTVTFSGN